jgi:MoaA/NifB/PqqE/SkfB family radical SAM enzyme
MAVLRSAYRKILPQRVRNALGKYVVKALLHVPRETLKFEVHLAEHCNLNCANCNHFSSLAGKQFLHVETYKRDCERLAKITSGRLESISLMGGEPLLHRDIIEIVRISRENFNAGTYIEIRTNGILLNKQKNEFWEACHENGITINISKYPIKLETGEIEKKSADYGVPVLYTMNVERESIWRSEPLDLEGGQNYKKSFSHCYKANSCIQLKDGKLYPCQYAAYINHFNKYFGRNLLVSDKDYISIYDTDDIKEILRFLANPVPFCRYCKPRQKTGKWGVSKKELKEWL